MPVCVRLRRWWSSPLPPDAYNGLCQRIADVVIGIDPDGDWDLPAVCAQMAARRGRELILATAPTHRGLPSAAWWKGTFVDYVLISDGLTGLHRWLVALHGVGHVIFDHVGESAVLDEHTRRRLLSGLNPDQVRRALPPWRYTHTEESEAEWFATCLLRLLADWSRKPPPTACEEPASMVLARLANALESSCEPSPTPPHAAPSAL